MEIEVVRDIVLPSLYALGFVDMQVRWLRHPLEIERVLDLSCVRRVRCCVISTF